MLLPVLFAFMKIINCLYLTLLHSLCKSTTFFRMYVDLGLHS